MIPGCDTCAALYQRRTFHLFNHMVDRRPVAISRWREADAAYRDHLQTHEMSDAQV